MSSGQRDLKDFQEYLDALMTLVEQRERDQKQTIEHLQSLLTWSLETVVDYHDLLIETIGRFPQPKSFDDKRDQKIVDLQKRYFEIVGKRNEQFLGQETPVLDDNQKHYIELFVSGKCTDGYLATRLGISWKDAEKLIKQYKKEEGTKE